MSVFYPPPIKIGKIFGNPCVYWEKLLNFAQFLKVPLCGAAVFSYHIENEMIAKTFVMTKREKDFSTRNRLAVLALFLLCFLGAKGQTVDYSGTYYIGSNGYVTPVPSPNTNYYLCPTEGWAFYVSDGNVTGTDNGKPFLTTYQCRNENLSYDATKAKWTLIKDASTGYYYIIQTKTGRYMVSNGSICGNPDRARVHLEAIDNPSDLGNKALFNIYLHDDHLVIRPMGITDTNADAPSGHSGHSNHKWLTVNQGNYNQLDGNSVRTDGPAGFPNTGGIICVYTENDIRGDFYLEDCIVRPTISLNASSQVVITAPAGTIHYTTDGSAPDANSTEYTEPFALQEGENLIKAVTIVSNEVSNVASITFYKTATPTMTLIYEGDGKVSLSCSTEGANIYYEIGNSSSIPNPTTSSTPYEGLIENAAGKYIKAIAVKEDWVNSDVLETGVIAFACATPVIRKASPTTFTITCGFPSGATIRYTMGTDPIDPTSESGTIYGSEGTFNYLPVTVKAIAYAANYDNSAVATKVLTDDLPQDEEDGYYIIASHDDFEKFVTMVNESEDNASANYKITEDIDVSSGVDVIEVYPFSGELKSIAKADGSYPVISGLSHAIFNTVDGGTVKNVILDNVSVSGSGNVGAICNEATGASRIYNCGVLGGTVSGGTNTGGLVGLIESGSSVRVVNCYNFANVSGGSYAAGIVGKNEGTVGAVRIALCMMYGKVTGASTISPVYCGNHVNNVQDFTEYNYWRYRSGLVYTPGNYNDQMAIDKDDYLTRFPFYRHILNTHRELAAYFLFAANTTEGSVADITPEQIAEIGHWVLKKDVALYPIIERWQTNTRKVLDADVTNTVNDERLPSSLSVTVKIGTEGMASGSTAIQKTISLPVTDMDEDNYDFTYGKVVLPFANEFRNSSDEPWTPNYGKICTGWKITDVSPESQEPFENYNVSDRNCTKKDLYSTTGFIFAQGGNYIVPYGVTAITIEANFANAYYLCDESYEIAYEKDKTNSSSGYDQNNSGYISRTGLAGSTPSTIYDNRTVYHTLPAALNAMNTNTNTTHMQAVVLVGNYHMDDDDLSSNNRYKKGFTIMSIDADNNQEPDYAIYSNNTQNRPAIPPSRFDFVAFIPLGMSSHVTGTFFYPNTPIWKPRGWFEITETGLMFANQFELESNNFNESNTNNCRCIINGGYFTQMVRGFNNPCTKLSYYQLGGKAYIKEFYPGNHSAKDHANKLVPVNVTGGEIEQCFMTGYGKGTATGSNIYFWCAGGKIHKFLGAYMERPSTDGVNMTAKIDHAIIERFFGGGTSPAAPITGNINITIDNSRVDFYCGGPEFGDMTEGKTVTTTANNTTFGEYYGAGFGGTATTYTNDVDGNLGIGSVYDYPDYFTTYYLSNDPNKGRLDYKSGYGIGNCYKFEYLIHSRGHITVARFYTGYASFSLATTGNVVNDLNNCTILNSFFGAGCQGMVDGTVTSTLTDCTVLGSAFGGGYKAAANEVDVYPETKPLPYSVYTAETGIFSDFGQVEPETYHWKQGNQSNQNTVSGTTLYTSKDIELSNLGNVKKKIKITVKGNSTVNGSVFGGGFESKSLSDTEVQILGNAKVLGNIYGGGNMGEVGGNTKVIVNGHSSGSNTSTVPETTTPGD